MKLPPVPGPRDVLHLLERGAQAVEMLLEAAPRAMDLLDEAGPLLARTSGLLERIEQTRAAADDVVRRTDAATTPSRPSPRPPASPADWASCST